jgi:hypothetical protein
MAGDQFPAGTRFSLLYSIETGSAVHPASFPMDTGALSPGLKRRGCEADHSPSYSKGKVFPVQAVEALRVMVEAPTFSDIRLIDGGNFVSLTRRPLFTPRKIPGTHFC